MTEIPFRPPGQFEDERVAGRVRLSILIGFPVATVILGGSVVAWPGHWPIYDPIAALFGPLLLMWLGWGASSYTTFFFEGCIAFLVVAALVLPCAFRTNGVTIGMFVLGILVWCLTGVMAAQVLWA